MRNIPKCALRFIPTPVGSMLSAPSTNGLKSVHPHACGEYPRPRRADEHHAGSSPRLWGVSPPAPQIPPYGRFIPTPVGSISPIATLVTCQPVHPHACGEYVGPVGVKRRVNGSSPRLWGVSILKNVWRSSGRFIPTPVGSIVWDVPGRRVMPVHPHACGEYNILLDGDEQPTGSSPRLWGVWRSRLRL